MPQDVREKVIYFLTDLVSTVSLSNRSEEGGKKTENHRNLTNSDMCVKNTTGTL